MKRLLCAAVTMTLSVAMGLGLSAGPAAATTATTQARTNTTKTTVSKSTTKTTVSTVKPIIRGLIDRQRPPSTQTLPFVHAYVVKTTWAALQPTANGPIADNNAIDQAITRVRQPDFAAVGMALKLRVMGGVNAPTWAKSLGGAPVPYMDTQDDATPGLTIGRFWTQPYEDAYARLQALLAAKYDNVPEIRELTVSGCTTIFDEPFARQPGYPSNVINMKAAGYTADADKSCISQAIIAHQVWKNTTTDLDVSPFPNALDVSAPHDVNFAVAMMIQCRQNLGTRCGLENNGLASSKLTDPNFSSMYTAMGQNGSPLVLQTASSSLIGNPQQVLNYAVTLGTNSLELPVGYKSWSTTMLTTANTQLQNNKTC